MSDRPNYPGVVLVTGAASGMGAAHARALGALGTHVCLADIADTTAPAAEIAADGGSASAYALDVADRAAWTRVVDEIRTARGELGGLVNNAGISRRLEFMDTPDDIWEKTLRINLFGPFYGIQAAAPLMRESGGGSIVDGGLVSNGLYHRIVAETGGSL